MPRLARGDEKPPMSADARKWWFAPSDARAVGRRRVLEPSGVLFLLAAMLDMSAVAAGGGRRWAGSLGVWCNDVASEILSVGG
jgi:hypothetical protein